MTRSERIEKAAWSLIRWFDGDGKVYSPPLSERIEEARAALVPDPLSCPACNHDPAVHKAGRCRYCEGPCSGLASEEGAGRGERDEGFRAGVEAVERVGAATALVAAEQREVERLRGALRFMLATLPKQMATVADADRMRPAVTNARTVLGEEGTR